MTRNGLRDYVVAHMWFMPNCLFFINIRMKGRTSPGYLTKCEDRLRPGPFGGVMVVWWDGVIPLRTPSGIVGRLLVEWGTLLRALFGLCEPSLKSFPYEILHARLFVDQSSRTKKHGLPRSSYRITMLIVNVTIVFQQWLIQWSGQRVVSNVCLKCSFLSRSRSSDVCVHRMISEGYDTHWSLTAPGAHKSPRPKMRACTSEDIFLVIREVGRLGATNATISRKKQDFHFILTDCLLWWARYDIPKLTVIVRSYTFQKVQFTR